MSTARIIWATPEADSLMGYIARVSNPANQDNPDVKGLLSYCARHSHWSVFEHAHACIEIETTRDIGRQILRHKSFAFSEFSQRYADVTALVTEMHPRECRLQDTKNRQNSIELDPNDHETYAWWEGAQFGIWKQAIKTYNEALKRGIAKEQARALLPEGLTPSRMYMTGSIRSWVTYCKVRLDPSTQKEHREISQQVLAVLRNVAPVTMDAFFPAN